MIKKTIILLVLYFFAVLPYDLVCGEKNILANLTNSQEPEQLKNLPAPQPCLWVCTESTVPNLNTCTKKKSIRGRLIL